MLRSAVLAGLVCAGVTVGDLALGQAAKRVLRIAQDGSGDMRGDDESPILEAIERLQSGGGRIEIGPGEYRIRRPLVLTSGITLLGTEKTVLELPPPVIVAAAAPQGQEFLQVDDASQFRAGGKVQVCLGPKKGTPEAEKAYPQMQIREAAPGKIVFTAGLPCDVPAGSRIGYLHNLVHVRGSQKDIRIENLTLDGGRIAGVPMPGHVLRCALLATGPYSYQKGPTGTPVENLQVLNCRIRNCYGRAVAFYSVARSKVAGCRIEEIADEAVDLDHFAFHCEVLDNQIRRGATGVTINDGSYCRVIGNRIEGCSTGITIWWWYQCPQDNIDVENVIQGNEVRSPGKVGIAVGKRCFRNQIVENRVEGKIQVVEADNVIRDNQDL